MTQYCYDYPRPAVAVDIAVLQWQQDHLAILLIRRANEPFAGQWALPGGFVDIDEPLDHAAQRELQEETGVSDVPVREFGTSGTPGRDPRGRTISILYYAIVPAGRSVTVQHGDDAADARWFDLRALPPLAFDHPQVLTMLMTHLRRSQLYFLEGFDFFDEFTIDQLATLHEAVTGTAMAPRELQERLQKWELLEEISRHQGTASSGRQPVYHVNAEKLNQIRRNHLLAPLHI